MDIRKLTEHISVSPQIKPQDITVLAKAGFGTIICNRPDSEVDAELQADMIETAAREAGLHFTYLPITPDVFSDELLKAFNAEMKRAHAPVFAYCRSGTRSCTLWALANPEQLSKTDRILAAQQAGYDLTTLAQQMDCA